MHKTAESLNQIIKKENPVVFDLLSKKGKEFFFPTGGIMAQSIQAKGKDINGTIGMAVEEDGSPMRLHSVEKYLDIPAEFAFPYASSFGRADLKDEWRKLQLKKNPLIWEKQISGLSVTNAITHGLFVVGSMFVEEGDTIILPNLYWGNYKLIFQNGFGANIETFNFFKNDNIDLEDIEKTLNNGGIGKKILLLNFPNNPTGYSPLKHEAQEIINIIKRSAEAGNKILALIDDAYFGIAYEEDIESQSIFAHLYNLHKNILAVKLDGATKEDFVWGFRVGFITYGVKDGSQELYRALEQKTAGIIRATVSNVSNLSQSLLMFAYNSDSYRAEKSEKNTILNKRYLFVKKTLAQNSKYRDFFNPLPFNSGYFMCVRLADGLNGEVVRTTLLEKYGTGIICMGSLIRVAFSSLRMEQIPILFENIYKACIDVKNN